MPRETATGLAPSTPPPVTQHSDIVFASPGGHELRVDLWVPEIGERPPIILFLHGGGWKFGDRKLAPDLERFFARHGIAMASIDYRLSGVAPFPAAVEDVKTAIRWLKSVADEYGFDGERLGLWGSSAGAHLATLSVSAGPDRFRGEQHRYAGYSERVKAIVAGYGPTDFLRQDAYRDPTGKPSDDPESIQMPPGKRSADADSMESSFLGAPIEQVPERVATANPARYVRPGLPPMLLLHGLSDTAVPWQQSQLLFEALSEAGSPVILGLVDHLGHGFFNRNQLDETGPYRVHFREGGSPGTVHTESRAIFPLVLDFFRHRL
ncbi:alpha/beta hydrolase fold domain-containing protein [Chromohalobacter israelensis]|uniref:alpha/beta hydrolase fold domain-containing protein n=1 Tax=Chromohalobacter israelensis TaxID=141390 RepID=UPI003AF54BBE